METNELKITVLKAAKGHWLTEATEPAAGVPRTYTESVYLGAPDSASRWKEITDAERAELEESARLAEQTAAEESEVQDG